MAFCSRAQTDSVANSIFWEISGNSLAAPSYILGTHHLLGSVYVDSLQNVGTKLSSAAAFISEITIDSTLITKTIEASIMKDSTLDQLLSPEWYRKTEDWLKEISIYPNLSVLNRFSPVAVELIILGLLQTELLGPVTEPMDLYLEKKARAEGKEVYGLESTETQLNAMFHAIPYQRQAESLIQLVSDKASAKDQLLQMNALYLNQDISSLESLLKKKYHPMDLEAILYARNDAWIQWLPPLLHKQSTFIAVGALHLAGDRGVVQQLRNLGYTVTPLPLR